MEVGGGCAAPPVSQGYEQGTVSTSMCRPVVGCDQGSNPTIVGDAFQQNLQPWKRSKCLSLSLMRSNARRHVLYITLPVLVQWFASAL